MLSVYKGMDKNKIWVGKDDKLKTRCDVCQEEMNFCDTYCYAKKDEPMINGHKRCVLRYGRSK